VPEIPDLFEKFGNYFFTAIFQYLTMRIIYGIILMEVKKKLSFCLLLYTKDA